MNLVNKRTPNHSENLSSAFLNNRQARLDFFQVWTCSSLGFAGSYLTLIQNNLVSFTTIT